MSSHSALKNFVNKTVVPACVANGKRFAIVPSMEHQKDFNDPEFVEKYRRVFVHYLQHYQKVNTNMKYDYECPKKFGERID